MKESNLRKSFMPIWQAANGKLSKLFRNNTGMWMKDGKPIFYGIGLWRRKNKRSPFRPVGGGDLIGWTTKEINGKNYAIFTSIELKTRGVPETQDQKDWKKLVLESGGIAEVIHE